MVGDKQAARTGDGSQVFQAQGDQIIHVGVTANDLATLKVELLEVVERSFAKATEVATERAGELFDQVVDMITVVDPERLTSAEDPGFQGALIDGQKSYARSGSPDLKDLLSSILVERSRTDASEIEKILLNEAINIAGKLTQEHMSALTVLFLLTRMAQSGPHTPILLAQKLQEYSAPFVDHLPTDSLWASHLLYCQCIVDQDSTYHPLKKFYRDTYPTTFTRPLAPQALGDLVAIDPKLVATICYIAEPEPMPGESVEVYFLPGRKGEFSTAQEPLGLSAEQTAKIDQLVDDYRLSEDHVDMMMRRLTPAWDALCTWYDGMRGYSLTSVGVALAHANLSQQTPFDTPLSVWLR
ncbi:MAG: hypothetical protein JWM47_2062 [Acidimicrobiales bacterium]|nr:hypothetical protein [Acidimicrobiales bacterium]